MKKLLLLILALPLLTLTACQTSKQKAMISCKQTGATNATVWVQTDFWTGSGAVADINCRQLLRTKEAKKYLKENGY